MIFVGVDYGIRPRTLIQPDVETILLLGEHFHGMMFGAMPDSESHFMIPAVLMYFADCDAAETVFRRFADWIEAAGTTRAIAVSFVRRKDGYEFCVSPNDEAAYLLSLPKILHGEVTPGFSVTSFRRILPNMTGGLDMFTQADQSHGVFLEPGCKSGALSHLRLKLDAVPVYEPGQIPEGDPAFYLSQLGDAPKGLLQSQVIPPKPPTTPASVGELRQRRLNFHFPVTLERIRLLGGPKAMLSGTWDPWQIEQAIANMVFQTVTSKFVHEFCEDGTPSELDVLYAALRSDENPMKVTNEQVNAFTEKEVVEQITKDMLALASNVIPETPVNKRTVRKHLREAGYLT